MFRFEVWDDVKYEARQSYKVRKQIDEKQLNLFSCRGPRDGQQFLFPLRLCQTQSWETQQIFSSPGNVRPNWADWWINFKIMTSRRITAGVWGAWLGGGAACYQLILSSNFWHESDSLYSSTLPSPSYSRNHDKKRKFILLLKNKHLKENFI